MSADPDSKPILEDDCVICGKWPARDRRALRKMIRALPVNEGPICKAFEMWWLFQVAPVVVLSHRLDIHPV